MNFDLLTIAISIIVLVFSAILHEVAHGYVAERLGDPTARLMGRLTLNPLKHLDPFLSVLLPLLLIVSGSPVIFGGAKPVPVDPYNLREGRKDLALVSLAGPGTNILLAIIAALLIHLLDIPQISLLLPQVPFAISHMLLAIIVQYNILLAIFNLLPIPPLDGSKIFSLVLPEREATAYMSIGQVGIFIIFILLAFPLGGFSLEAAIQHLYFLALNLLGL